LDGFTLFAYLNFYLLSSVGGVFIMIASENRVRLQAGISAGAALFSAALACISISSTGLLPANSAESLVKTEESASLVAARSMAQLNQSLPDGVYLYGESPKPNEIGKGYFVFESKQGKVVGALYMPSSSFDCASGSFQGNQLALTVTNSYDRSTNPFAIALERNTTVAAGGNSVMTPIGLRGFHKIDQLSEMDQRILKICKTDLQGGQTR
jgi:hypothetical protein